RGAGGRGVGGRSAVAQRGAAVVVRRAQGRRGRVDGRRILRRVRLAGRRARVRGGDPTGAGRTPAVGGLRAEGADRPARVRRDAGGQGLLGQGGARGVADRGA